MSDKISDIPKIKTLLQQLRSWEQLVESANSLRPYNQLFIKLGLDINKIADQKTRVQELLQEVLELSSLADRFNDHFAKLGWIVNNSIRMDVIRHAIQLADTGQINDAEIMLVDYYTHDVILLWLNQLKHIKAFRSRMRLAHLALKDFDEGRYHACIPVVLALMDGLVNELNEGRGFFADSTELIGKNSIVAHKKGLVELSNTFSRGRRKTHTESITIPYRHGIMHGNDLGYDNKTVSAKTWSALFAVGEWAEQLEKDQLDYIPPEQLFSWTQYVEARQKVRATLQNISQWMPRKLQPGQDYPQQGSNEDYSENSPERRLVEFFNEWAKKNYGNMAKCVIGRKGKSFATLPREVRKMYENRELVEFQLLEIIDTAPAVTVIEVRLRYVRYTKELDTRCKFRLLFANEQGYSTHGQDTGIWSIMNWRDLT
jgi:type II secretory pathway component PulM